MLDHRLGAICANVAHGYAVFVCAGQVDVIGASCGESDEAKRVRVAQCLVIESYFVCEYELGTPDSLSGQFVRRDIEERQVGQQIAYGRRIEIRTHCRVVEKHGFHDDFGYSLSRKCRR